jgi:hypothetical protein
VSTLAAQAKLEKEFYPPITRLFGAQGLYVWEEATLRAGAEGARRDFEEALARLRTVQSLANERLS